jgi:peroxiredoxin
VSQKRGAFLLFDFTEKDVIFVARIFFISKITFEHKENMKLKKMVLSGLLGLCVFGSLFGQQVSLSFPTAAEKEMNLYYFSGARADTLTAVLDASGKTVFILPKKDYRGIIVLGNQEQGLVELILAEPKLEVACHADVLNIETAKTENSAENAYLKQIFNKQSQQMRKLAWLEQGELFHADLDTIFIAELEKLKSQTQQAIEQTNEENSQSSLFAARLYEVINFMNRIYEAEHYTYSQYFTAVKAEMEKAELIPVMYHSGNMWLQMHNMYISLFNRMPGLVNPRQQYAESIMNTLSRLQAPYFESFLAGSILETERFGWAAVRDTILTQVLKKNPDFKTNIPLLQVSLSAFFMRNKGLAPEIAGLLAPKGDKRMIVAFHDGDCDFCENEMNTLARRYGSLQENNIRVVSIAADRNKERFEAQARNFPWADKLCDLQGFEGVNFTAFGVFATPAFFVVSKDGRIEGEFNDVNELIETIIK